MIYLMPTDPKRQSLRNMTCWGDASSAVVRMLLSGLYRSATEREIREEGKDGQWPGKQVVVERDGKWAVGMVESVYGATAIVALPRLVQFHEEVSMEFVRIQRRTDSLKVWNEKGEPV